jgi:hypothetical protein
MWRYKLYTISVWLQYVMLSLQCSRSARWGDTEISSLLNRADQSLYISFLSSAYLFQSFIIGCFSHYLSHPNIYSALLLFYGPFLQFALLHTTCVGVHANVDSLSVFAKVCVTCARINSLENKSNDVPKNKKIQRRSYYKHFPGAIMIPKDNRISLPLEIKTWW